MRLRKFYRFERSDHFWKFIFGFGQHIRPTDRIDQIVRSRPTHADSFERFSDFWGMHKLRTLARNSCHLAAVKRRVLRKGPLELAFKTNTSKRFNVALQTCLVLLDSSPRAVNQNGHKPAAKGLGKYIRIRVIGRLDRQRPPVTIKLQREILRL